MKTKLLWVVMVISCLNGFGHAQSLSHYNWRSINEIGAAEIQVIEMIIRRSATEILSSAKSFTRSNNTLILADKVGVLHFFASGSVVDSARSNGDPEKKEDDQTWISKMNDDKQDNLAELSRLRIKFVEIWGEFFDLGKGDIREADLAAQDYFTALNKSPATVQSFFENANIVDHLGTMAMRGNRYFGLVKPLLKVVTAEEAIGIYGEYLNATRAILSDRPSPAEVVDTLYKIGNLAISNPNTKISFNLLKSMEILTPDLYQKLAR